MPIYTYKARDAGGKAVKDKMDAATKTELIDKLHKMGYMVTGVSEETAGISKLASIFEKLKRINSGDMLMFYIQLSNMISAGLSILMSLDMLSSQIGNKNLKELIKSAARRVESGSNLSQAFVAAGGPFDRLFVNMIKAGEASGKLDTVLMRYATFFERQEDLKQTVKNALFYPVILLSAGIAVMLFIVTFVIPKFADIYIKAGISLPLPTLIVFKFGLALKSYWYIFLAIAAAIFFGLRYYFRSPQGMLMLDTVKLKLPLTGTLYRRVAISRFARTLATLLGSGVPILQSLDIIREILNNEVLSRVIVNVRLSVEKGDRMSEPLRVSGEFPQDVVQMISVGEETGHLDAMLNKIADFYDMTVSYTVKRLTTVIEPLFLVILGGMIGFVMAAMLLPMFDMIKVLRH